MLSIKWNTLREASWDTLPNKKHLTISLAFLAEGRRSKSWTAGARSAWEAESSWNSTCTICSSDSWRWFGSTILSKLTCLRSNEVPSWIGIPTFCFRRLGARRTRSNHRFAFQSLRRYFITRELYTFAWDFCNTRASFDSCFNFLAQIVFSLLPQDLWSHQFQLCRIFLPMHHCFAHT